MNREKAERYLKIGLIGAFLTLIGDLLIGAAGFPDGANMIEGYLAIALAMPAWRPVLGGLIGFAGICLEVPALMTICPLIREKMPRGGRFYPPAKRTPSTGAVGYHRMGGDEFAPYGMTPKVFLPCIFSPIF